LQSHLMQKISDQVARHILIWVQPEEHLRLECVTLPEPERNCPNRRDLSPVAADWRNGRIGALFGPALGRDRNVTVW
jgi:hypothetical protein